MVRIAYALLVVAACAASSSSTTTPEHVAPNRSSPRTCAAQYEQIESNWASYMPREQATSPFRHCPHWHQAMPDACGAPTQPSFVDPCHCLCDLCDKDADCGPSSSCVTMSSTICGSYEERVCVLENDPCHPKNAKASCPTYCVTLFGKPQCISREEERMCRR